MYYELGLWKGCGCFRLEVAIEKKSSIICRTVRLSIMSDDKNHMNDGVNIARNSEGKGYCILNIELELGHFMSYIHGVAHKGCGICGIFRVWHMAGRCHSCTSLVPLFPLLFFNNQGRPNDLHLPLRYKMPQFFSKNLRNSEIKLEVTKRKFWVLEHYAPMGDYYDKGARTCREKLGQGFFPPEKVGARNFSSRKFGLGFFSSKGGGVEILLGYTKAIGKFWAPKEVLAPLIFLWIKWQPRHFLLLKKFKPRHFYIKAVSAPHFISKVGKPVEIFLL